MKALLQFNLDDTDDAMAHYRSIKSLDMALFIWEMSGKIRTIVDTSEDGKWIDADLILNAWNDMSEQYDINIHKLVQ